MFWIYWCWLAGTRIILYGGYFDAWVIICDWWKEYWYPENEFVLVSDCAWEELFWFLFDRATALVASLYTRDNLSTLLLDCCLFYCKLCTSSVVDRMRYVWNSLNIFFHFFGRFCCYFLPWSILIILFF